LRDRYQYDIKANSVEVFMAPLLGIILVIFALSLINKI